MTDTADRRDITEAERPWLEALDTLPQLAELRRRIIAAGESPATASGLVGWLLAKKHGDPDVTGSPTRSKYRRILGDLGAPTRPKRGRRQAGYVKPQVMPLVAGAGAAAAAAPHSIVASAVAVAASLYVTRTGGEPSIADPETAPMCADVIDLCAHREHVGPADVRASCAQAA